MSYFSLFSWPNHSDRNKLAKQHFDFAKKGFKKLVLEEDVAFCLARNAPGGIDTGKYIIYLVGTFRGGYNDSYIHQELLNFFKKCKCPKYQEFQSPDIGRGLLTVDNLTVRLEENRMRVLEGPVLRRAGSSQVFQEKTLIFQGKSIEETKATATASVPSGQDFSLDIQDVQTKTVEEKGESADAAIEAANAKIPSEAFDISSGEIINENHGQEGVLEIEGDAEWEARIQWKMSKPFLDGAQLLDMNCVREASKGFLGIGKRQSVWEARWSMPFIAQVSYKLPAVVRVRFYEEI